MLSVGVREDIDYVDVREPVLNTGNPDYYTHNNHFGIEASTYAGVHVQFSRNLGVSAGYRWALGLTNSSIADGRSGTSFGLTIGI